MSVLLVYDATCNAWSRDHLYVLYVCMLVFKLS